MDIGPCLSIPASSRVLTFDVQQAANLAIVLCVGISKGLETRLVIAQPFMPAALKRAAILPLISGDHNIGTIEKIWMVSLKVPATTTVLAKA